MPLGRNCSATLCKWCVVVTMIRSSANSTSSMCQFPAHTGCVNSPFDMSRASAALEVKRPVAFDAVTKGSREEMPVSKDLVGGEFLSKAMAKNRLAETERFIAHPACNSTILFDENLSRSSKHAQLSHEERKFHTGRGSGGSDENPSIPTPRPVRFPTLKEILTGHSN